VCACREPAELPTGVNNLLARFADVQEMFARIMPSKLGQERSGSASFRTEVKGVVTLVRHEAW
jgi:hypothetical protein